MNLIWTSSLTRDARREHRINANSFQQSAVISHRDFQYACFYSNKDDNIPGGPLLVNIARRHLKLAKPEWETLTFTDYEQAVDDGHNTISIGVCPGDGTIHISWDHHCDRLRYRTSIERVASEPEDYNWEVSLFGPILDHLPGATCPDKFFDQVTYPRFLDVGDDLLLSYRIGMAGTGSEVLFTYKAKDHGFRFLGQFLTGLMNSPYINGISYSCGRLHVSGTYRRFIDYEGVNDPNSTSHKANAGPNGPENNYNLFYLFSDNAGLTFQSSSGNIIADLSKGESVYPDTEDLVVFDIPMDSGILNQESQASDDHGGFHVLNRENERWIHYSRKATGGWNKYTLPGLRPSRTGARGSVITVKNRVIFALPGNYDNSLTIMGGCMQSERPLYKTLWVGDGFSGEPHLDLYYRGAQLVVSIFTRSQPGDAHRDREVVVMDFEVEM